MPNQTSNTTSSSKLTDAQKSALLKAPGITIKDKERDARAKQHADGGVKFKIVEYQKKNSTSADITAEERAYQLARPHETSTRGLEAYHIVGLVIVWIAVLLRLWGKRLQKSGLKIDDYILVFCAVEAIGYGISGIIDLHHGFGHHTLTISKHDFYIRSQNGYANNLIYTTCFPLSRMSLVILYKRVFAPKRWFGYVCWVLIFAYAGYAISTIFVDAFGVLPVKAAWDKDIPVKHTIDWSKLVLGNCIFNNITDTALLVLPLIVIWSLQTTKWSRVGLSFVFSLGVLTLIAACMRCYYALSYDLKDPDYTTGTGAFWTVTEVYLGLLCPCLVTLHPVIVSTYGFVTSRLSSRSRDRVSKFTGVVPADSSKSDLKTGAYMEMNSTGRKEGVSNASTSLHSRPSDLEAQDVGGDRMYTEKTFMPVDKSGMAVNQDAALASLDPRLQGKGGGGAHAQPLGSSARAGVNEEKHNIPENGIGVERQWDLESRTEES